MELLLNSCNICQYYWSSGFSKWILRLLLTLRSRREHTDFAPSDLDRSKGHARLFREAQRYLVCARRTRLGRRHCVAFVPNPGVRKAAFVGSDCLAQLISSYNSQCQSHYRRLGVSGIDKDEPRNVSTLDLCWRNYCVQLMGEPWGKWLISSASKYCRLA